MSRTKAQFKKTKRYKNRTDKWGFLHPANEHDISRCAHNRYMNRKEIAKMDYRFHPTTLEMKKYSLKYLEYSLDELIENGYVYFLKHKLYIVKVPSRPRRTLKEDMKWNGNEYLVLMDHETRGTLEYRLGKEFEEKLYNKVKNNWNYYEQLHIRNT